MRRRSTSAVTAADVLCRLLRLPYHGANMAKPKTQPQEQPESDATPVIGSQEAYERFLPVADAIDASLVQNFRADATLAYHNVDRGLDEIAPFIDQIKEQLPTVRMKQLVETADLALAVMFAAAQVDRGADGSTQALLAEARASRAFLMASADALAAAGLFPARAVQKIHEGNGLIDSAQDCVDLAALFAKHAKEIKGKTAVTSAQVTKAASVGTELLKRLKSKRTKGKQDSGVTSAVEKRDRLWTLLVQRHKELRRVGMWLWMDEVDAHVPALQSRAAPAKKREKKAGEPGADKKPEAKKAEKPEAKKVDEKKVEEKKGEG